MTNYLDCVGEDTEMNIRFEKTSGTTVCSDKPDATSLVRRLRTGIEDNSDQSIEYLRHQNLPITLETSFVTVYLQGASLVGNYGNRWLLYRTLTADSLSAGILWRQIQAGIALRGVPHVAQVVNMVVDSEREFLKGVLVELPSKGTLFGLLDSHNYQGKPVPWPLREKWAKQITQGAAAIHERRQVIGGLRTHNHCVCIVEHNDAKLMVFT
jgi:hypothetical protein